MKIRLRDIQADPTAFTGEITVNGWVKTVRESKAAGFIELTDGRSFKPVQIVFFPGEGGQVYALSTGSAIRVTGTLVLTPEAKQPFEIHSRTIEVLGASASDYPLQKKRHSLEFLRTIGHLRPRANIFQAVFRVRSVAASAVHEFFQQRGFIYVHTPILTGSDCEGAGDMFRVTTLERNDPPRTKEGCVDFSKDFFSKEVHLTVSGQLYGEAFAHAFGEIYTFGPTFRAEKSKTRRHLQEFWMVEPEIPFCKLEELLEIEEQFVSYIVRTVLADRAVELKVLERDISHLQKVTAPFERLHYDEAVAMINAAAAQGVTVPPNDDPLTTIAWGDDFGAPHETYLTMQFEKPVFVHHFPIEVKAFYMEPEPDRPEVCRSADLLAPEGYGEIIGGSERMSDPAKLLAAIEKHKLPADAYDPSPINI